GGFLIGSFGVKWTLVVIISLIFTASLFFWNLNKQHSEYKKETVNVVESMREGISYIFKTKEILGALCLDMFAVLFGGAVALIPVFATDILDAGAEGFGFLNAASDIGSM
ncbi:MFS transporter, partial [Chryseobacterium sp. SIMBA_028]